MVAGEFGGVSGESGAVDDECARALAGAFLEEREEREGVGGGEGGENTGGSGDAAGEGGDVGSGGVGFDDVVGGAHAGELGDLVR